ncbi:1-aminocyclopropane-1-carboxylate deaminase [Neobacillus bataviensis LMG 21833]|uniref:1-aminocyclopropane-1-carboxylate deaminase n=1 Tax=Neobacillus bataviensis LMG 21833 TaxID=1117379 RepID=K6DTF7_9BACI|nr:pyridoxal-phosphate dependent enzyme [Neobacillus bataviensis]EKN71654.1 1-aminocyclopropane-1-carboxylate deaminase [Neobacillus bataviensis LMG 21833]
MNSNELESVLQAFPKAKLAIQASPLQRLVNLEQMIHVPNVFVKRDDLNGLGAGGNKVRNLEYLLGDALERDCDVVIASGQIDSNLCMLTAAACRKLGIECALVHNNDAPKHLKGNMILNDILGIKQIYLGEVDEAFRSQQVDKVKQDYQSSGRRPYVIYNGASTPLGSLGYVDGALELFHQITNDNLHITDIFVPGGNGGLAAGMIFGAGVLDLPFHVHVVSVEHAKEKLHDELVELISGMEELTNITVNYPLHEIMTIYEEYRGEGWNRPTAEADQMIYELARLEGIFLEKTYTSKAFLGMKDLLATGKVRSVGACFLHSGGFSSLFSQY